MYGYHICIHRSTCLRVRVCVCANMFFSDASLDLPQVLMCLYFNVYIYVCASFYICVGVCVCVCVFAQTFAGGPT